jgi:1,2-diacylglycerol-3-alpha-glucose alpha-1,2-galactosyltransferase
VGERSPHTREVAGSNPAAPITVALVSESTWTVRDHGVHTAFVQQANALRRLGHKVSINSIRACRESDLTITHSPGPWSMRALRAGRGLKVAMAHVTPDTLRDSIRGETAWSVAMSRWLRTLYQTADITVAVSPTTAKELENMGIARERIVTCPLGIDPPMRKATVSPPDRHGRKLVLGVGQLQSRKGIEEFARVAVSLPQHDFVWAGGRPFGPLTAGGLKGGRLRSLGASNLTFTGRISYVALQELYARAHAFLFPSRQENFGQVVVEAAHHGLPLLLSRIPAFEDHFEPEAVLLDPGELGPMLGEVLDSTSMRSNLAERSMHLSARLTATAAVAELLRQVRGGIPTPSHLRE